MGWIYLLALTTIYANSFPWNPGRDQIMKFQLLRIFPTAIYRCTYCKKVYTMLRKRHNTKYCNKLTNYGNWNHIIWAVEIQFFIKITKYKIEIHWGEDLMSFLSVIFIYVLPYKGRHNKKVRRRREGRP